MSVADHAVSRDRNGMRPSLVTLRFRLLAVLHAYVQLSMLCSRTLIYLFCIR